MKICIFIRSMPAHGKGGIEDHALMLARGIAEKGHGITIITTKHPKKTYEKIAGIKIYYLKKTLPGKYSAEWWTESIKKFEELYKKEKFDIVHSQSSGAYYFLKKKLNKKYNIPVVVSLHGTTLDEIKTQINTNLSWNPFSSIKAILLCFRYLYNYPLLILNFIRRANAIIATSNEQREIIKKIYFVDEKKIYTIFNAIDTKLFVPKSSKRIRKRYNIKKEKMILSVAKLEKEKGVQNIIKALPKILSKINAKLMIVGDGSYKKELEKLVNRLGLKNSVIFTGFVPLSELPYFFNECDVFVNSTIRQNGYDLTILEAMACQKPVVVSNIGSVPTAVSKKDGILVPPGSVDSLVKGVIKILSNPRLASKLSKNARKKILKDFTLEKMVSRTIDVYKSLIEGS